MYTDTYVRMCVCTNLNTVLHNEIHNFRNRKGGNSYRNGIMNALIIYREH